mgnify:CR=1 FL=1|tara:strand:+ start:67 stop:837 length:771 start_codon:yes stop_codon:yes gene_type:complete
MSALAIVLTLDGPVARIRIDRPEARNAMTLAMYETLVTTLDELRDNGAVRLLVLEGNDKAFAAGTEISEFTAFASGLDGLAYEAKIERVVNTLETMPFPTLAAVKGVATGGGLMLAVACDLQVMSVTARIGAPIARTVGNCLSSRNLARLQTLVGPALLRRMLLAAELVKASEIAGSAFPTWLVEPESFDVVLAEKIETIAGAAPLTQRATKASLVRIARDNFDDADIIERTYGSADFAEGVGAFLERRKPVWQNR